MSTVDQHDHPSVEQLAEYAEGLLTEPPAVATVDVHLAGCAECQQVLRDLGAVTALLQAAPDEPMPASVAVRLASVLSAEARERRIDDRLGVDHPGSIVAASTTGASPELAEAATAAEPPSGVRPHSLSDARRRRRARTVSALAAVATVAAFAIGAAIFSQNMSGVENPGGGAVAGREQAQDNAAHGYTGPTPATGGTYQSASGQDFTAYTLSAAARGLLAERAYREALRNAGATPGLSSEGGTSGPVPAAPGSDGSIATDARMSALLSPAGLAACVAQLVPDPADVQVLATDVGTYDGAPAALLVLSDPTDPAKAQVRVVGTPCGQGQAAEYLRTEIQRG